MNEISKKLSYIQDNLKAKKSRFNKFGNYYYRALEDILEAVKPLLKEQKAILVLDDELMNIGDRYYIKATATLFNCEKTEGSNSISVCGYAREDKERKKFDGSQLTGSASSYARKYALNGLFLIDDTKDSDSTNIQDKKTPNLDKLKKSGINQELNQEAYKQIEARKKAISKYSILLEFKKPTNQDDMLKTFKTKNIEEMRELYKQLQES